VVVTRVALVGLRCTGKTTVGRLLAARLGWEAVDSDDVVIAKAGKSVARIFADDGEAQFREREADAVKQLCGRERIVIATGGGAILQPESRTLLQQSCYVVWLTASPDAIAKRMTADPETLARRPSLTGKGVIEEVSVVLAAREPLYREAAHLVVATEDRTPDKIAADIERAIQVKG
jgi:shikimate kinase